MRRERAQPLLDEQSNLLTRTNFKLFIRVLLGFAFAQLIGQQFRPSHAAPHSKSNWKNQPQKVTIGNDRSAMVSSSASPPPLDTTRWQPGQMKNCTEPGQCPHLRGAKGVLSLLAAIVEFPDDLFTQSQRRSVSRAPAGNAPKVTEHSFPGRDHLPLSCLCLHLHRDCTGRR